MKTFDVHYDKTVRFIGRNGYFKQSGIEIAFTGNPNTWIVILQHTTSKNETGRCSIERPIENVAAVMNALSQLTGIE